jgi:lysophospholipase L1-like esterase
VPISFFGPGAIVGTVLSSSKPPQVAFFVDSIGVGFGDTANINASTPGPYSWITRGINNAVPAIRLGGGGDLMANFPNLLATRRMAFASGATTAVMCQGTNDIFTTHLTLAQMQTNLTTWANMMKGRGVANLFAVTLLPRTTSTDSWATTTNQTVLAQEAVRTGYNDWLRNTAPGLLGLTCIETADTVETSRNSGKWVVNGSANYATADGIHPSSAAHTLMAAALPVSSLL